MSGFSLDTVLLEEVTTLQLIMVSASALIVVGLLAGCTLLAGRRSMPGRATGRKLEVFDTHIRNKAPEKKQRLLELLQVDREDILTRRLAITHLMTAGPNYVLPDDPIEKLIEIMRDRGFRHVPVCDDHQTLVGIVSDRDVRSKPGRVVADVMTHDPASVTSSVLVEAAAEIMLNLGVSCLPVVTSGGRLEGILTTSDIVLGMLCTLETLEQFGKEITGALELALTLEAPSNA